MAKLPAQESQQQLLIEPFWPGAPISQPAVLQNHAEVLHQIRQENMAAEHPLEGRVVVEVLVSKQGLYESHKVIRPSHPQLLQLVESHLKDLQFSPAIHDDEPDEDRVIVAFMVLSSTKGQDANGTETRRYSCELTQQESKLEKADVCKATYTAQPAGVEDLLERMSLQGLPDMGQAQAKVAVRLRIGADGKAAVAGTEGMPTVAFEQAVLQHVSTLSWSPAVECGIHVASDMRLTFQFTQ